MKLCKQCNKYKKLDEFPIRRSAKDGRQSNCSLCRREMCKVWYKKNQKYQNERTRKNNKIYKENGMKIIYQVIDYYGCQYCGTKIKSIIDFHHVRDKKHVVSKLVHLGYAIEKIKKELEKCIVLCANHHRMFHAGEIEIDETKTIKLSEVYKEAVI